MIAVVCAHNPGKRNLGMYSVDVSAQAFFDASRQPHELVKFTGHRRIGAVHYKPLDSLEHLVSYEAVVFWGDFQQNPLWAEKNFGPRYARKHRTTDAEGFQHWRELCLLESHRPKPSQRIYSVGTCFLGARDALREAGAVADYSRALARFHAILPRDEGSLAELRALGLTNVVEGFDCATLQEQVSAPPVTQPCFGYSFGRTLGAKDAAHLVQELEHLTGHRGIPIEWLLGRFTWKRCRHRYARALQIIRSVRYVVTDIYHLTVNTLNLNRDLVCVGRRSHGFSDTCDEDKKAILLRMAGLQERYVELAPDTQDPARAIAARIADILREPAPARFQEFNRRRDEFRARLHRLLWPGTAGPSGSPTSSPP